MYPVPIQYLDDLYKQNKDMVLKHFPVINRLVDLYKSDDIEALRCFSGYLTFSIRTDEHASLEEFSNELETLANLMIDEIQGSMFNERRNGLRLVK